MTAKLCGQQLPTNPTGFSKLFPIRMRILRPVSCTYDPSTLVFREIFNPARSAKIFCFRFTIFSTNHSVTL